MQKKQLTALFALSALSLAMAGSVQAAVLSASDVAAGSTRLGTVGLAEPGLAAGSGVAGINGNTAVVIPFAPVSSINITTSRHNLGTGNTLGTNHTPDVLASNGTTVVGTNQICVFCHTPHGFNTTQSGPLWNKSVKNSAAYRVYNASGAGNVSSTLDAQNPSIGSVSLACLSCHDGTQAMDNMINGPGSTRMNSNANSISGQTQGYTWLEISMMAQSGTGGANEAQEYWNGTPALDNNNSIIVEGVSPTKEGINLGTDLSNDHPISVQYCGGGLGLNPASFVSGGKSYPANPCADRQFNLPVMLKLNGQSTYSFWVDTNVIVDAEATAFNGAIGADRAITRDPNTVESYVNTSGAAVLINGSSTGAGFIQSGGDGVRTKSDIMLFTNNSGVTGNPSVECASCHDPHTPNNGTFLRVSNAGSGLCLSCHVK